MSSPGLIRLRHDCRTNPSRFNRRVLGRPAYWWRQAEIAQSVRDYPVTLVPAGNSVGKSYVDAGIILWFLNHHPGCKVLVTAPSQVQLEEVLWAEVARAHAHSRIPLGGRITKDPLKIDKSGAPDGRTGTLLAYSTSKTERFSGHHAPDLLAVVDEASGVAPEIFEAIDSLNPSRLLLTGNPLRPDGPFYERCTRAELRALEGRPDPLTNLIRIPSLESPDIGLARSLRGLADASWLAKARGDYGEGSIWWQSHVLAMFPDAAADSLIPRDWLDRAAIARHDRAGPARMGVDLGGGNAGDRTVVLVRDDNGVIDVAHSNVWDLGQAARECRRLATAHLVSPHRVTYDRGGLGNDFANRLAAAGLAGAFGYLGGASGGRKYANLRTAAAWELRRRLDPSRLVDGEPQTPFAIPPGWIALLRKEIQAITYRLLDSEKTALQPKEDLARTLGHSPNFADALIMSFAYPNN